MTDFVQSGPDAGFPIGTPMPDECGQVLANFYVDQIIERPNGIGAVVLRAVTKGPNNWSRYSPAGTIELTTVNPRALAWFRAHLGTDTRVTFGDIPAPDAE
jgi:hypothetical protein